MTPLAARLDGIAADVHRLACRLLGPEALAALHEGSQRDAQPINPNVIAMRRGVDLVTEGLRAIAVAAGEDPALVGADHYGKRPADPSKPSNAPTATATETDHA